MSCSRIQTVLLTLGPRSRQTSQKHNIAQQLAIRLRMSHTLVCCIVKAPRANWVDHFCHFFLLVCLAP